MNFYLKRNPGRTEAGQRVALRFAVIYAAGCLAKKFKILDWRRKDICEAVSWCHRKNDIESFMPFFADGSEKLVRSVVATELKKLLPRLTPYATPKGTKRKNDVGYIYLNDDKPKELLLHDSAFEEHIVGAFTPPRSKREILAALIKARSLNLNPRSNRALVQRNLPGEKTKSWVRAFPASILEHAIKEEDEATSSPKPHRYRRSVRRPR